AAPAFRRVLALNYGQLPSLLNQQKNMTVDAEAAFRTALGHQKKLGVEFPAVLDYQNDLAASWNNLANLMRRIDNRTEAGECFRQAVDIYARLAKEHPSVTEYKMNSAIVGFNLGILLSLRHEYALAVEKYTSAIESLDSLLASQPRLAKANAVKLNIVMMRA